MSDNLINNEHECENITDIVHVEGKGTAIAIGELDIEGFIKALLNSKSFWTQRRNDIIKESIREE
jgi:hypothetical protein